MTLKDLHDILYRKFNLFDNGLSHKNFAVQLTLSIFIKRLHNGEKETHHATKRSPRLPTRHRHPKKQPTRRHCFNGRWHWIVSDVLLDEVNQNSNIGVRFQIKNWMTLAHQIVSVGANESKRGMQLEDLGFKRRDALHLACAESAEVDIFLTTDDRLLRRAKRYQMQLHTQVENPYIWLQPEV